MISAEFLEIAFCANWLVQRGGVWRVLAYVSVPALLGVILRGLI